MMQQTATAIDTQAAAYMEAVTKGRTTVFYRALNKCETTEVDLSEYRAIGAPCHLIADFTQYGLCQQFRHKDTREEVYAPALFKLGKLAATPGALDEIERYGFTPFDFVGRHIAGDWSHQCRSDALENAASAAKGYRVFSSYYLTDDRGEDAPRVWVITEHDRSVTTLLLPSEY